MPGLKDFAGTAVDTKLSGGINNSVTSLTVLSATGWPSGSTAFVAVIDNGLSTEEKILVGARSGTSFTGITRGWDGTNAVSHSSGAEIVHVLDADTLNDLLDHVYDTGRDDHTGYLTTGRHANAALHAFGGALGTPGSPSAVGTTAAAGTGTVPARSDHTHALAAGVAGDALSLTAGVLAVAVDGATVEISADTLRLKDAGVTAAKIAAAVAGAGLAGGAGTALSVNVDGVGIECPVDTLQLKDLGVVTAKINDLAVTTGKLAANAVTQAKVASGLRIPVVCTSATRPGTPSAGDQIYETDTSRLLIYNGSAWTQPWNMPWGYIGSASKTTSFACTGSVADVTGLSVTATLLAGRMLRYTFKVPGVTDNSSAAPVGIQLRRGSTDIDGTLIPVGGVGFQPGSVFVGYDAAAPAGSNTIKVTANGAATATLTAAAGSSRMLLLVEDIGPA